MDRSPLHPRPRRTVLTALAAGLIGLAGCTSSGTDGGGGDDGGDGDDGGGDGGDGDDSTAITDRAVETTDTDCLSGEPGAEVARNADAGTVVVTGTLEAPNPCHEATLRGATYDPDADRLAVDVGTAARDVDACVECVGAVSYRVTVSFSGPLPAEVTVAHDGEPVTADDPN